MNVARKPWNDGIHPAWRRNGARRGTPVSADRVEKLRDGVLFAHVCDGGWRVVMRRGIESRAIAAGCYDGPLRNGCAAADASIASIVNASAIRAAAIRAARAAEASDHTNAKEGE